ADRDDLLRGVVSAHARALSVDERPASPAGGSGDQRVLHARAIFVDVGLVAGAVPHAYACYRNSFRVQHSALYRIPSAVLRRDADRTTRRLQQDGGRVLVHLYYGL